MSSKQSAYRYTRCIVHNYTIVLYHISQRHCIDHACTPLVCIVCTKYIRSTVTLHTHSCSSGYSGLSAPSTYSQSINTYSVQKVGPAPCATVKIRHGLRLDRQYHFCSLCPEYGVLFRIATGLTVVVVMMPFCACMQAQDNHTSHHEGANNNIRICRVCGRTEHSVRNTE